MKSIRITLLLCLFLFSSSAFSESDNDGFLSGYQVTAGVNINQTSFDVSVELASDPSGVLISELSLSPFLNIGSPYKYFENSNWGWYLEYNLFTFSLDKQEINGNTENYFDLGTSVDGYSVYWTPTLLYSFSGQNPSFSEHQNTLGLGVGIGFLKASGDIIFTETTNARESIDINNIALAVSLFYEYRFEHFMTRIGGGSTTYSNSGLDYASFAITWSFGYLF